jgi:arylsulfatase A-like enzyme
VSSAHGKRARNPQWRILIPLLATAAAATEQPPQPPQPNIVFVLADDLNADWKSDRLSYMPNLREHFSLGGTEFVNHAAFVPVCGPSRSSFLLGRYPHNTRYMCNSDAPSVAAFVAAHNSTVGAWLRDAGYHTAFLGKYVHTRRRSPP